jgi:hypothetical protein
MAPRDNEGAQHLIEAQTGLDRMVRELRAAYNVVSVGTNVIEADIVQRRTGVTARVRFDCRIAHPVGGASDPLRAPDGLGRLGQRPGGAGRPRRQRAAGVDVFTPRVATPPTPRTPACTTSASASS